MHCKKTILKLMNGALTLKTEMQITSNEKPLFLKHFELNNIKYNFRIKHIIQTQMIR